MINKNSIVVRFAINLCKVLIKLIIGCVILALIAINWDVVAMGKVVRGKHFVGLIVKNDPNYDEGWTLTAKTVLSLEDDLQKYIIQALEKNSWIVEHLPEYKIQYWGYIHDGGKILQINFHHSSTVEYGLWKIPFGVLGGGYNHFTVTYDMSKNKFTRLSVNCDA